MSGGITATTVMAAAAVAGTAYQIYAGNEASRKQDAANAQAQANATKQAAAADQAMNRANQKKPDTAGALGAAQQAGAAGNSGTLLTGPTGVDPTALALGKNTLLGG